MSPEKTNLCKKIFAGSAFFQPLNDSEMDKLLTYTRTKNFKSNEIIFSKGDEGGQLYAILSGRIKINTLSREGKEITISILGEGKIFGEIAMFDNEYRTATATMHTPGEVLIIEQRKFIMFLEQTPKISVKLILTLCSRLRQTTELLEDTLFYSLPVRFAKKLLALAEYHGVEKAGEITIDLKLSQTELGNLVNSTRESINKLMREWKQSDIIGFKNGIITIKDINALEDILYSEEGY